MKIIEIATRRRVTIAMFTVAILLFGAVSLSRLQVNLLPDLSYPTLTIRTEYVGAAPAEIENLITKPIEEAVGVVKNVRSVQSVSRAGQSDVTLQFVWGTNMDFAGLDVREKLDALMMPLEAERPVILRFDPSMEPIIRLGLIRTDSDSVKIRDEIADLKSLRRYSDEQIKKLLESTPGVAAVKISGGYEDEISVAVDQSRLAQLEIPIERVSEKLRAENVNLSGGRLEEGIQQYLVRTLNQFTSVAEMDKVILDFKNGAPVYLGDVASVTESFKEREAVTRVNGKESIDIGIYKEGDANTVSVADGVKLRIASLKEQLPKGFDLIQVYDQSVFISKAVDEVVSAAAFGGILAILVLYFFLRDFWATVIVSISIPASIIATFNLMSGADLTLNIMSLGGIALGIGMLVDNSIVVLENISRFREQGMSAIDAAREGASEVGTAVIASTLTTVAVFLPLVFVDGIAGQLFKDQALTVTFSLMASLVVALTLIPMLSSLGSKSATGISDEPGPIKASNNVFQKSHRLAFYGLPSLGVKAVSMIIGFFGKIVGWILFPFVWLFNKIYDVAAAWYPKVVVVALNNRFIVVLLAFSMLGGSLWLVGQIGIELIPQMSQGELRVEMRTPPGTPLYRTDARIAQVQNAAKTIPLVEKTYSVAGTGNKMNANPDEGGQNWGELSIVLPGGSSFEQEESVISGLRETLDNIPALQYKFSRPVLFSFSTPIEIEVAGYDLKELRKVSNFIADKMTSHGQFADVKSSMKVGQPELQIIFDREKAAALGLDVNDVANRIVTDVRGTVATRFSYRERKIDVMVRAREEDRSSIKDIKNLIVNPNSPRPVPLSAIADIVEEQGPGEIIRRSQDRVAIITANLAYGDLGTAAAEIQQILDLTPKPGGVSAMLTGQNAEMASSFQSLQFALALAIFLVYLVMASQFESLLHPLIILISVPLALIGAILALFVTGTTISVVVFIGLIMLAGIVVNNAIVLIDLINQLRAKGMEKFDAIVEGGRLRLRPILMTTATTVLGLLPMAIGLGEGSEIRAPMAITVIGGLLVSTLLTLVVIPVVYHLLDRKKFEGATA